MFAFTIRRIIQAILVMLVISFIGFAVQYSIGDPVRDMVGIRVSAAEREALREKLGLNDSFWIQYSRFVRNATRGDLGTSYFYSKPALQVILQKAPATLELVFVTAMIIVLVSLPFIVLFIMSKIFPLWLEEEKNSS